MKERFERIILFFIKPTPLVIVLSSLLTLISVTGALTILFFDWENDILLSIIAYLFFAIAAVTLSYSVYLIVRFAPRFKAWLIEIIEKHEFTRVLLHNYGFRTVAFTALSLFLSIAYGVYHAVLGVLASSGWYGTLAFYYIVLSLLKGGIVLFHNRKRKGKYQRGVSYDTEALAMARTYLKTGILLVLLDLAFASSVTVTVIFDRFYSYAGWTIYASAAYAFYKMTMSIINIIKVRGQSDITLAAVRNINLADAMVSIFALQTALLATFGGEMENTVVFNAAVGFAVCVITLMLGIMMIIRGRKEINKIKTQKTEL